MVAPGYNPGVHPIAFELGPIRIHWYGIMVAVGVLAGLWTSLARARRTGLPTQPLVDMAPWVVIGGLIGARALFVVMFWREFFAEAPVWEVFMIYHGGLVFYGGVLGGVLAGLIYAHVKRLPVWRTADVIAPGVLLGYAFGRIGCFLNGCCYGRACELPWAVRFPAEHETGGLPVHPTQLYEAVWALVGFLVLDQFYGRRRVDGWVTGLTLVIYAVCRSVVELFRGDYPAAKYVCGLTPGQLGSIPVLVFGLLILLLRKPGERPELIQGR